MSQDDERRVLHEICRNTNMGIQAIEQILDKVYDEELAYELHVEAGKMKEFESKASQRLYQYEDQPADLKPIAQAMLKGSIRMKTMFRTETGDIAEMMQKGNRRGAEELKNAIHRYKNAGIYATELAKDVIDFEEKNLKKLESYRDI